MATPFRNRTISTPELALSLFLLSFLYSVHGRLLVGPDQPTTYKVGVFEHAVIAAGRDVANRDMALEAMQKNIDIYRDTVLTAKSKGVKLLVFPEYGIYGENMNRKRMSFFAEEIPDPKISHRNPCRDPEFKGQSTLVQRLLSCIARDKEIYLVINMAGREICKQEAECPPDGHYLYNTNVVFSPNGDIVARYYKTHLFGEKWFNPAKSAEAAIFDTPFGKFATFICFDVMFEKPTVELIKKYNIRNIAFPTAWIKLAPIFRSIQMHSAFARGSKVNFLSADLHVPKFKSYGSGIYTPNGAAAYYYRPNETQSKLIVADIQQINDVKPATRVESQFNNSPETKTKDDTVLNISAAGLPFKFKHLKTQSGSVTVCHNLFCCKATYEIEGPFEEMYALGVYNGYMLAAGNKLYMQICTLLNCPSSKCGTEITSAKTVFSHISLQGSGFTSKYVYPSVLAMDKDIYKLVPHAWVYSRQKGIQTRPAEKVTLHSANFIGRDYSKDILVADEQEQKNSASTNLITKLINYVLYLATAHFFVNF